MEEILKSHEVIPHVITKMAPHTIPLNVHFGSHKVDNGNVLNFHDVQKEPSVSWEPTEGKYYTLVMTDPDAPSRKDPKYREWRHWIVGNINAGNNLAGTTVESFMPSGPPPGTGLHRYIFLLYEHSDKISHYKVKNPANRAQWKVADFAHDNNLGLPIAVNFYQCERK